YLCAAPPNGTRGCLANELAEYDAASCDSMSQSRLTSGEIGFGGSDLLQSMLRPLREVTRGEPSVKIGVVDGIPDLKHLALEGAEIEILEALIPDGTHAPDGHGTSICSVVFGNERLVEGIAPGCSGLVAPIFFGDPKDDLPKHASQLDLARAITFAAEQ